MNGFQHLPEYQSAARAYRLERTHVARRAPGAPEGFRALVALLAALRRRRPRTTAAPRGAVSP